VVNVRKFRLMDEGALLLLLAGAAAVVILRIFQT